MCRFADTSFYIRRYQCLCWTVDNTWFYPVDGCCHERCPTLFHIAFSTVHLNTWKHFTWRMAGFDNILDPLLTTSDKATCHITSCLINKLRALPAFIYFFQAYCKWKTEKHSQFLTVLRLLHHCSCNTQGPQRLAPKGKQRGEEVEERKNREAVCSCIFFLSNRIPQKGSIFLHLPRSTGPSNRASHQKKAPLNTIIIPI